MSRKRTLAHPNSVVIVVLAAAAGFTAHSCSRAAPMADRPDAHAVAPARLAPAPANDGPPLVHLSGLVLDAQPTAYRVRETDAGFDIEPANTRRLRNPWSVRLRLAGGDAATLAGAKRKRIGDREIHYLVDVDAEAGSGGPLYTLTAWTACGPTRIIMTATQQAEPPVEPDWSAAWGILQASRCEPRR